MASNHEAGFLPQAPARNMSLVRHGRAVKEGVEILGGTGRPVCPHLGEAALKKLYKFGEEYDATSGMPLEDIGELEVSSKAELVLRSQRLFSLHAVHKVSNREDMRHASLAGCGVTVAFLDMIARMRAEIDGSHEFDEILYEDSVKKSLSTLMAIAATSREADGALTRAIMNWTVGQTDRLGDKEVYTGLAFDSSFFSMHENGAVEIKSDKATRKRIRTVDNGHFDFSVSKDDILFGCPFRSRIPLFYDAMTRAMVKNGLAEESYMQALPAQGEDI